MAIDMNPGPLPIPKPSIPNDADPEIDLAGRLAFLGLKPEDARTLHELAPIFQDFADRFVAAFYEHLFSFEPTAQFLQDPERLARLKQMQRQYFESLLQAGWNKNYVEHRNRIGQTHRDVGLAPEWFLGAYSFYLQHCFRGFAAQHSDEAREFVEKLLPLVKVILLDIGLTLDAYFAQATQKLRQALNLYWRANDDLRRFAQLTSHDLKTPLATVANLCDEALDEFGSQMPPEARELIRAARDRTFQNSRMIDELLSSTLSMHAPDAQASVSMDDVLHDVRDRVAAAATAKGVTLELPSHPPAVWGNKVRLREAFYNLVSNAIKFLDKPQGKIGIHVEPHDQKALFIVADNGPGIPQEELESIFVPFRRLPSHRHLPGSGLGLYFTKQLIESEGGRIWVESTVGKGSRFFVQLPVDRDRN